MSGIDKSAVRDKKTDKKFKNHKNLQEFEQLSADFSVP